MKVAIDQKVLVNALTRGGMAALSEKAQADTSSRKELIQSVHIKIDTDLTISSACNVIASKFSIPISADGGIDVKETGECVIKAKELLGWVKNQLPTSKIGLILKTLASPELINVTDSDVAQDGDKHALVKLGTVNLASKDQSKTGARWNLDSYDPSQLPALVPIFELNDKVEKIFTVKVDDISTAVSNIKFAAEKTHYQHLFDNVTFYQFNDELYALTTDRTRCATYKIKEASDLNIPDKALIPADFLHQFIGLSENGDDLTAYYDEDKNKIFLSTPNCQVRLATAEKSLWGKIPSIQLLHDKQYGDLGAVPKNILMSRLVTMSMVTKGSALFTFANDSTVLWAKSENSTSPMVSNAPVVGLTKDAEVALQVNHVLSCLKKIKDEDVKFGIPANDQESILISSEEDENFRYYIMAVNKDNLVKMKQNS